VLATQTLLQKKSKNMLIQVSGPGGEGGGGAKGLSGCDCHGKGSTGEVVSQSSSLFRAILGTIEVGA
jgi:hypothetical protein